MNPVVTAVFLPFW